MVKTRTGWGTEIEFRETNQKWVKFEIQIAHRAEQL
jgi:hypothetical protein